MEKSKLISIANLLTYTNTCYIPQVIRTTPRSQSPTASLSAYAVFAPKMIISTADLQNYKPSFVRGQISRAKLIPTNDTLKEQSHDIKKPSRVPFTITYNPALPNINKILQKKQPILNSTARLQKIYKETHVVAYRR